MDGLEEDFPSRFSRGRHRGKCPAMKGVMHRDDLTGSQPVDLAPFSGQLDRPLVGLDPAVREKHLVHRRMVDDLSGEFQESVREVGGTGVDESSGLFR